MKDFKTVMIYGKNPRPAYNYQYQHTYKSLDAKILHYLLNHYLNIKVFGYEIPEESKGGFLSPEKSMASSQNLSPDSDHKSKKRPTNLEILIDAADDSVISSKTITTSQRTNDNQTKIYSTTPNAGNNQRFVVNKANEQAAADELKKKEERRLHNLLKTLELN